MPGFEDKLNKPASEIEEGREAAAENVVNSQQEQQAEITPVSAEDLKAQLAELQSTIASKQAEAAAMEEKLPGVGLGNFAEEIAIFSGDAEALKARIAEMEAVPEANPEKDVASQEDAMNQVASELEALPQAEKEKISLGFRNVGFFMEKIKCNLMAKGLEKCASVVDEKGTMGRFIAAIAETYRNDEKRSDKNIERAEADNNGGKILETTNLLQAGGNILKAGRMIAGGPMTGLMLSGATFARGFEAAKEARLKNEEVMEKNRMDIDAAAEMAWALHEKAQEAAGGEDPSREDLQKVYQKNIPTDVLKKLEQGGAGSASGLMQKMAQKYLEFSAKRMDGKIKGIEGDAKLSLQEKNQAIDSILNNYTKQLNFIDRSVSETGQIDMLAVGARAGELAGKSMVAVSLAELVTNAWDKLADVASASASEIPGEGLASHAAETMHKIANVDAQGMRATGMTAEQWAHVKGMSLNEINDPNNHDLNAFQKMKVTELMKSGGFDKGKIGSTGLGEAVRMDAIKNASGHGGSVENVARSMKGSGIGGVVEKHINMGGSPIITEQAAAPEVSHVAAVENVTPVRPDVVVPNGGMRPQMPTGMGRTNMAEHLTNASANAEKIVGQTGNIDMQGMKATGMDFNQWNEAKKMSLDEIRDPNNHNLNLFQKMKLNKIVEELGGKGKIGSTSLEELARMAKISKSI